MVRVFLLVFSLFTIPAFGQITVDSSHIANLNDLVIQENDTNTTISLNNYTTSGGSQSWNFTALTSHYTDTFDLSPASTGWGSSYFTSSDYTTDGFVDTSSIYLSKTNTDLDIDGAFQVDGGDTVIYKITHKIITFPSTSGTSYIHNEDDLVGSQYYGSDPDGFGPHPYVDSLGLHRYLYQNSAVNAWGTATMSKGIFNTIRQDTRDVTVDSIKMYANGQWQPLSSTMRTIIQGAGEQEVTYDTTWTLRFWSNDPNVKFPLVTIDYEKPLNTINSVIWIDEAPLTTSFNQPQSSGSFELYPNPAEGHINMVTDYNGKTILDIYNMDGRKVHSQKMKPGKNKIFTQSFSKGIYLYRIVNEKGEMLHSGKFGKR